ncbi:hypothetical protein NQ317_003559 [Molorchus minor]|uniref:DUF4371 domain-containing protein n=1 Tax=Molorchus minor TaxID=1323400 RepID=A0ABQ9J1R7_9CUCU|nr:hypothetical protein NQ317_003559 [Molorchus minor]
MVAFVAEHNLAISVSDHLPKLIRSICPDSEIAKKVKLDRKKGTKICKSLMKRENLLKMQQQTEFSQVFPNVLKTMEFYFRSNSIGFGADNASTMMGHIGGVQQQLLQFNPDLYVLGYTCHSLNLCSSAACTKLPNSVKELTRDIYPYFLHSNKRPEAFAEYQLFTDLKPHKILRPSQTRWLSLESVINRHAAGASYNRIFVFASSL